MLRKIGSKKLTLSEQQILVADLSRHLSQIFGQNIDDKFEIRLFGSITEGKMTEASDIDCAFIIAPSYDVRTMRKWLFQQLKPFRWPLDFLILGRQDFEQRRLEPGVCQDIALKGYAIRL